MTKSGVNLYLDAGMQSVANDHPNFSAIMEKLLANADVQEIEDLVDIPKNLLKVSQGHISIVGEELKYDGTPLHNALTVRIIDLLKRQKPVDSLMKFMDNLMQNPSFRAVNELYGFLEACTLPITADGHFLAYKKVSKDYMSIHANPDGSHIDNHIGQKPSMPRNMVDEDSERTCSNGLHVCSYGYLDSFGSDGPQDHVLVVKINPKDVVAVPKDYNNQKMRVCAYEVVSEIPQKTEIKDRYNTDETYIRDEDEDEDDLDDEDNFESPCADCDDEDCESRDVPFRGTAKAAPQITKTTKIAPAKKAAPVGNWECRSAYDPDLSEFYANMTAGKAKYKFAQDFGVDFTDVRIRKA